MRLLFLALALGLTGCVADDDGRPADLAADVSVNPPEGVIAGDHGAPVPDTPTSYVCAEGGTFSVTPSPDGQSAEVELPGETLTLDRAETSMGVRYGEGDVEVWIAADGAFVAQGGEMTLKDCEPAAAPTDATSA